MSSSDSESGGGGGGLGPGDPPDPGAARWLEEVSAHADRLLEVAEHGVTDVNALSFGGGPTHKSGGEGGSTTPPDGGDQPQQPRTLEEKLLELHIEESLKDRLSWSSHLNPCSNLLNILCKVICKTEHQFVKLLLS